MLSDAEIFAFSPQALALLVAFRSAPPDGLTVKEAARAAGVAEWPAKTLARRLLAWGLVELREPSRYVVPGTPLPPARPRTDVRHASGPDSRRRAAEPKRLRCLQCGREFLSSGSRAMFCQELCASRYGEARRRNSASQE